MSGLVSRIVLAFLLLATSLLHAQNTWNGWRYQTPAGWQAQPTASAMVFHPGSAPGANNFVRLMPPQPGAGELATWFQRAVSARTASLSDWHPGETKQNTNNGVHSIETTGHTVNASGTKLIRAYMGMIDSHGRGLLMESQFESAAVLLNLVPYGRLVSSLGPASGSAPMVVAHEGAGSTAPPTTMPVTPPRGPANTPRTVASNNNTAAPRTVATGNNVPAGIPADDGVSGVRPAMPTGKDIYDWFGRFYTGIMPGPNMTISQTMNWEFYRFFPNGYVWEGGAPFNVDPGALNCPGTVNKGGTCKHYKIAGSSLTIEGEKPHTVGRDGMNLKVDGNIYNRVRKAGAPFNGSWETSAGGGVGSVVTLSQHTLTMRPDGSFSTSGSTGVLAPNATASSASGGGGHYKLTPYTIEFDYNDGHTLRQALMLPYQDDGSFLIGRALYFIPRPIKKR